MGHDLSLLWITQDQNFYSFSPSLSSVGGGGGGGILRPVYMEVADPR